ncbi:MAG: hypothetical protein SNJ67_04815 [Chloracidobacterium sp.]
MIRPRFTLLLPKRPLACLLLALVVIPGLAVFLPSGAQEKSPMVVQKVQKQGDPLEFLLPTPDGPPLDAEQLRGKVSLLCFAAYGFPLIRPLLRQMQEVSSSYPQVTLCLVLTNGTQPRDRDFISDADLKTWREQQHLPYRLARDPRGSLLFRRLNLSVIPSFVILRKDGTVAGTREGLDPTTSLVEQLRADLIRAVQADDSRPPD